MKAFECTDKPNSLYQYTREELRVLLQKLEDKPAHAKAIYAGLYRQRADSVSAMENVPVRLQEKLKDYPFALPEITKKQISEDGTVKYLFRFQDGHAVEGVLLQYGHGHILCLSTQKGCKMGCDFCASSKLPFAGNLTAGEIVGQYLAVEKAENIAIRNLVYMGIGEPLDNADEVLRSLQILTDPWGPALAARHISVSTCGVVPGILRMAKESWPCRLAVSLHHVDDAKRSASMPVNRRWNIPSLMEACKRYTEQTGYLIFFEYALIPCVNNRPEDAQQLIRLVKNIPCRVNLIELNPLEENRLQADDRAAAQFRSLLQSAGIFATQRRALGQDIDGACGQLRGKFIREG